MKRWFSFLFTLIYLFQLFSPAIILAQAEPTPSPSVTQVEESESSESSVEESSETESAETPENNDSPAESSPEPSATPSTSLEKADEISETPSPTPSSPLSPSPTPNTSPSPIPTSTPGASPSPTSTPTPTPLPSPTSPVATVSASPQSNSTDQDQHASSSPDSANSSTDQDAAENASPNDPSSTQVEQSTGDALATGQVTNVVNTNISQACLLIESYQLTGQGAADFSDPICQPTTTSPTATPAAQTTSASTASGSATASTSPTPNPTSGEQNVTSNTELTVTASTGNNGLVSDGQATLQTGDAYAVASLQEILNSTLINSHLIYQIFNLWPGFQGDIILPRADQLWQQLGIEPAQTCDTCQPTPTVAPGRTQQAELEQTVNAAANSGNNALVGSQTWLATGDTYAAANVFNLVNSQLSNVNWYLLFFQIAGQWEGHIYGWTDDSTEVLALPHGAGALGEQSQASPASVSDTNGQSSSPTSITTGGEKTAVVHQSVTATANTGHNQIIASDEAAMSTGRAVSIANLFSLINSSLVNSRLYVGVINVLGDWAGNLLFAYPELAVHVSGNKTSVPVGDTVTYTINYQNQGYDTADNAQVVVDIPAGTEVVALSGPEAGQLTSSTVRWDLGAMPEEAQGQVQLTLRVSDWNQFALKTESDGWLSALMPVAHAAEPERQIKVTAHISSSEPQSSTRQNKSSVTTAVYQLSDEPVDTDPEASSSESDSDGEPNRWDLELSVKNNVAEFVYPGDTVTFTTEVGNPGDATVHDAVIVHQVLQGNEVLLEMAFPIGDLPAHRHGQLEFGLQIPDLGLSQATPFTTHTWVEGQTAASVDLTSPTRHTTFLVQPRWLGTVAPPAQAAEPLVPQAETAVLGEHTASAASSAAQSSWWLLLGCFLGFLLIRSLRRLTEEEAISGV